MQILPVDSYHLSDYSELVWEVQAPWKFGRQFEDDGKELKIVHLSR